MQLDERSNRQSEWFFAIGERGDIESIQLQGLQGLVKNTFGEQVASSNNAITLIQRLWDSVENHRKLFGNSAFADSDEQKKFAKILADMQTK